MGVVLGTLTTKDGQVIPLPTASDQLEDENPRDEYRKEEEGRYKRCIRRPLTNGVWDGPKRELVGRVIMWDNYKRETENIKRRGMTMNEKIYSTKSYRLFKALFANPNVWLGSRRLHELTGVPISSVSVMLRKPVQFLMNEGLLDMKDDPNSSKGILYMFKGQCENPDEEARIWYTKMFDKKPPAARRVANPKPQVARVPVARPLVAPVEVDTSTMEAIVRVPLNKLEGVLKLLAV